MRVSLAAGLIFAFVALANSSRGTTSDLEIHIVPRGVDNKEKRASDGSGALVKESWVYDITIENKTFKDLTDLQVNYAIFYTKVKFGSTEPPENKREKRTVALASLKPHEKKVIATEAIQIEKHRLVGGWYYPSGAKSKAEDTLDGLWVRIMQGGQVFAEYANPSTLLKEKWE